MNFILWRAMKDELYGLPRRWLSLPILLFDAALLYVAVWPSLKGEIPLPVGIVALVGVFVHWYVLKHEATHKALCRARWLNDGLGHFFGWAILMPFLSRQRSHLLHHIWTGHPVGDPSNARMIRRFSAMTSAEARRLEWIWSSWIPLIAINDRVGLWVDPIRHWLRGSLSGRIRRELWAHWGYWLAYAALVLILFRHEMFGRAVSLLLPAWLSLLVIEELLNLPHHAETPLLPTESKAPPYWEQFRYTHSCRWIPIWSRWLILNFNFHTAHHLFPDLPWYRLEQAQRQLYRHLPDLEQRQNERSELGWSALRRRTPLLSIMGHYFDHRALRGYERAVIRDVLQ